MSTTSTHFAPALQAARDACASQHYPQGALYIVATPIGNLADISLRALHVLQLVDVIACEDTRHTQALLRAYGMDRPGAQLLAVHQHNESEGAQRVLERLQQGQRVAYASDAGTPGVSDPGARLVAAVRAAGLPVVPLPGASSITTAVSVAGLVAQGDTVVDRIYHFDRGYSDHVGIAGGNRRGYGVDRALQCIGQAVGSVIAICACAYSQQHHGGFGTGERKQDAWHGKKNSRQAEHGHGTLLGNEVALADEAEIFEMSYGYEAEHENRPRTFYAVHRRENRRKHA